MPSRPFPARFHSRCAGDCGRQIEPEQLVAYVDDEVMHEECAELDADANRRMAKRKTETPCTACWLVHAGECA